MKLEDYLRTRFAGLMYPAAQAFVLNPFRRRVLFCVPFWCVCFLLTYDSVQNVNTGYPDFSYRYYLSAFFPNLSYKIIPTIQSAYLLLLYELFGRIEIVAQLAFLLVKIGLVWQIMGLGEKVLGSFKAPFFVLPAMVILLSAIGSHLVWLFFFLWALNNVYPIQENLKSRKLMTILSLSGLLLTGLEGPITVYLLLVFEFLSIFILENNGRGSLSIFTQKVQIVSILNILKPYVLGAIVALGYLVFHHYKKDWLSREAFYRAEFLRSIAVSDEPTISISLFVSTVLVTGITIYCLSKIKIKNLLPNSRLILLLFGLILMLKIIFDEDLFNANYLILNLLCLKLISDLKTSKMQTMLYVGFFMAWIILFF